jgi:hypothetical protein
VRTERHKLILRKYDLSPEFRPSELYDLDTDPDESVNLYPRQRNTISLQSSALVSCTTWKLVSELAGQLEKWARATRDDTALELATYAQAPVR